MFCSPGQHCDRMFEFYLPSPAAAGSSAAELWYYDLHHIPRATILQLATLGLWRHHTSHFSTTVTLERQLTIKKLWMNESHLHCHLFLHTILSFPSFFNCLISPTPCIVKAGCVLSVLAMAGPGPISRHYALSAAPDTSKMGTFPSDPPLAPAKMWIQLLNTGIGISNERQLGGGSIYQGLKHLWRAAEIWKSFSPVHCQDHQQF